MKKLKLLIGLFLYSFALFAKTVVITDIDDTLKKANSMGKPAAQAYHFLRKIPYYEMRDLFLEIKNIERQKKESFSFYYVSAAYSITFDADKWIDKYQFPKGRTILKTFKTKTPTYDFKYNNIKNILLQELKNRDPEQDEELVVLMFGDNSQYDANVYYDLSKELNLNAHIFIRDVRAEATFFDSTLPVKRLPNVNYFFSEIELMSLPIFDFISSDLREKTLQSYKNRQIIPEYTLKTLERRIEDLTNDKGRAKNQALSFWNDYYQRF